jgi:hypothetical protein
MGKSKETEEADSITNSSLARPRDTCINPVVRFRTLFATILNALLESKNMFSIEPTFSIRIWHRKTRFSISRFFNRPTILPPIRLDLRCKLVKKFGNWERDTDFHVFLWGLTAIHSYYLKRISKTAIDLIYSLMHFSLKTVRLLLNSQLGNHLRHFFRALQVFWTSCFQALTQLLTQHSLGTKTEHPNDCDLGSTADE